MLPIRLINRQQNNQIKGYATIKHNGNDSTFNPDETMRLLCWISEVV